ncbi:MAG: NDP-hexose 4-ketoreductase, partial [Planctomycetales bacterium]|nr:NDP-hexose 4-ketoreductase [Planctomycetales bacterium]
KEFLIKKGSNTDYGARPLRRAIESFIEDPLAEELLKGEFNGKDTIRVTVKEVGEKKQLTFDGLKTKEDEPEPIAAAVAEGNADDPGDDAE